MNYHLDLQSNLPCCYVDSKFESLVLIIKIVLSSSAMIAIPLERLSKPTQEASPLYFLISCAIP